MTTIFQKLRQSKTSPKSVLYVGRFVEVKGAEYLVKAFKDVKERVPDAHLFLGGYGPEEGTLKSLVKELELKDVEFLGKLREMIWADT